MPDSQARLQCFGTVPTPDNGKSLQVPEVFGHAFITPAPNSTAVNIASSVYPSSDQIGVSVDDPNLDIPWPVRLAFLSARNQHCQPLEYRLGESDGKLGSPSSKVLFRASQRRA